MFIMAGWWYTYPSEKYEFVKWDYCSQYTEKKMFQTTNQHSNVWGIQWSQSRMESWLVVSIPPKNKKVNWDDDIPNNYMEK